MQDHILPYMLDDRHIDDTLFIVLEEDFSLFEGKEEPIASMPKLTESQKYLQEVTPSSMSTEEMGRRL